MCVRWKKLFIFSYSLSVIRWKILFHLRLCVFSSIAYSLTTDAWRCLKQWNNAVISNQRGNDMKQYSLLHGPSDKCHSWALQGGAEMPLGSDGVARVCLSGLWPASPHVPHNQSLTASKPTVRPFPRTNIHRPPVNHSTSALNLYLAYSKPSCFLTE